FLMAKPLLAECKTLNRLFWRALESGKPPAMLRCIRNRVWGKSMTYFAEKPFLLRFNSLSPNAGCWGEAWGFENRPPLLRDGRCPQPGPPGAAPTRLTL